MDIYLCDSTKFDIICHTFMILFYYKLFLCFTKEVNYGKRISNTVRMDIYAGSRYP